MDLLVLAALLLAQSPSESDYLREVYQADAVQCEFYQDEALEKKLTLVEKPILTWDTDDDWSGDVFVWTHAGRPEVVGCILSGPGKAADRRVYHEFHVLGDQPIAPAKVHGNRRWTPQRGINIEPIEEAPPPAATAPGRLVQMRQLSRNFSAHMEADGKWELRLLPQPLFRYGTEESDVLDGGLFAYVWSKGTDPEFLLLLESRKNAEGERAWHFAPVRFTTRPLWLTYAGKELWRVDTHREPGGGVNELVYTTAFARSILKQPAAAKPPE